MKRKKSILLILVTLLFTGYVYGSVGIAFQFANKSIIAVDDDYYLEFDILVNATEPNTHHNMLQMFIEYNTDIFGTNVCRDNTTVTRYPLLADSHYFLSYRDGNEFIYAINTEARSSFNMLELPVTPTPLVHVSMKFQEVSQNTGVIFREDLMIDQQYYGEDFTPYDNPPIIINALDDLDDSTVPVVLSSFTAAINPRGNVLLSWVTQTESNCLGYRILRNQEDDLTNALDLQTLIRATNTSQQQSYCFEDKEINEEGEYFYWLQSVDLTGETMFYGPISLILEGQETGIPDIPLVNKLHNAYPNPFNPSTTISYSLQHPSAVMLDIFNTRGQKVRSFTAEHYQAGLFNITWDGKDYNGNKVPSGIYYYRLQAGSYREIKKMVMSK